MRKLTIKIKGDTTTRGLNMQKKACELARKYFEILHNNSEPDILEDEKEEKGDGQKIIFLHGRSNFSQKYYKSIPNNVAVVVYTGSTSSEIVLPEWFGNKEVDSDKWHIYLSGITESADSLNLETFFSSWTEGLNANPNNPPPLDLLKYSRTDNLVALAILCQGYLGTHGGEKLDGWDRLDELKNKLTSKRSITENSEWWRIITQEGIKNELVAVSNAKSIESLVVEIFQGEKIHEKTVEDAYGQLREILGRR